MMEMFAGSKETGFGKLFGRHTAKTGTKGWKVYKKSVTINAPVSETHWQKTPKQVCNENLAHKMQQGMSKSDVLAQEWKLQTIAVFSARATADREATIKNGNPIHDSETKSKALAYAVNVLCERVVEPRSAFRDYDTFRRQPDRFVRPGRGAAEHGAFVRPAQGGFFGQGRPFRPFFGNVRPAYRFGVRR
jgi:hypothetical protein